MKSRDLLEDLIRHTDLNYISDLHDPKLRKQVIHSISSLKEDDYTCDQWNEAAKYILSISNSTKIINNKNELLQALNRYEI